MDDDDSNLADYFKTRNSDDDTVNARGKELLDLWKLKKLEIINGRKPGDLFGKYTCHNWNSSSVFDYFLSSIPSSKCISSFCVGTCIPWLSDHCIIKTIFSLKTSHPVKTTKEELSNTHPGFLWNETAIYNYKNNLISETTKKKVSDLISLPGTSATDLAGNICELMLDSVSNAKVKVKKRAEDLDKKTAIWFDNECRLSKENLNHVSNKFSKSPKDNLLRQQVFEAKKNFKKIILAKKRKYRKKLVNDL